MSYEMRSLRKEDISLHMYIKNVVLRDFLEVAEFSSLMLLPDRSVAGNFVYEAVVDFDPKPKARGRGWVYFDEPQFESFCTPFTSVSGWNGAGDQAIGIPEQYSRVTLYDDGGTVEVPWTDYIIDYTDGRVVVPYKLNNPKVTYAWNYVSVVDEWAPALASSPPVVVIDVKDTFKKGYQLGSGKESVRTVDLHIFASGSAERNDLKEVLHDGLYNRSCVLYDLPTGTVLDFDGTFYGRSGLELRVQDPIEKNMYLFDASEVSNASKILFESVRSRNVNASLVMSRVSENTMLSDLNAYRATINFNAVVYDDRVAN